MYKIESPEDGGTKPGPNFGLIVVLFCAVILAMFLVAYMVVPGVAGYIHPQHPDRHPTSQLVRPSEARLA